MQFTHQLVAEVSLVGMAFDLLGGFYLAYDLLGGSRGPLGTLARAIGYTVLFFLGYFAVVGFRYALIAAIGMGLLLGVEYRLAATRADLPSQQRRRDVVLIGCLRGAVLGLASTTIAGGAFGAVFGLLCGVGLAASYAVGFAPLDDYESNLRVHISRRKVRASILRAIVATSAAAIAGWFTTPDTLWIPLALRLGLAAGAVSALVGLFSPPIESWIENLPERRLGVMGLGLIFVGMVLQSVQYWIALLDIPLR